MRAPSPDFLGLLRSLFDHGVDFILVGGVAAVLHGAPISTFDLDVVHWRSQENIERLLAALQDLDAYYRGRGEQRLRPDTSHLASPGHQLLMTRFGPFDVLGTIGDDHSYEDLVEHTVELWVSGMPVRVLDLKTLIAVKEETGHEKDRAVIPILKRTLEEISKA